MSVEDIQQDKLKRINRIIQSQDFSLLQKRKTLFDLMETYIHDFKTRQAYAT
jgi:hypothetical protein